MGLDEYLFRFVVVYLDDILIFSSSVEEYWDHVKGVLLKLRQNRLVAKMQKCESEVERVSFLGYVTYSKGFSMDPTKV